MQQIKAGWQKKDLPTWSQKAPCKFSDDLADVHIWKTMRYKEDNYTDLKSGNDHRDDEGPHADPCAPGQKLDAVRLGEGEQGLKKQEILVQFFPTSLFLGGTICP